MSEPGTSLGLVCRTNVVPKIHSDEWKPVVFRENYFKPIRQSEFFELELWDVVDAGGGFIRLSAAAQDGECEDDENARECIKQSSGSHMVEPHSFFRRFRNYRRVLSQKKAQDSQNP